MLKSNLRILLADDHPLMLDGLRSGLDRIGYHQIKTASDGQEVISFVSQEVFDLAILDIEMPRINGFEIVEYLQKNDLHTPVIFLSYHKEKRYLVVARKLGVKGYILKEDGINVLDNCIREVLGGREYYSPSIDETIRACPNRRTDQLI